MIAALLLTMFAVADEPPLGGRPPNFSGIVGRFRIEADVDSKSVTVEDPLTLRVTIHGESVTTPPTRGNLRIFPEDFDFYREEVAEEDRADPATGTWTFVWRLRPKTTDVREVPPLRLSYWSPMLRRFQAATTEAVPIEVGPQVEKTPVAEMPLDVRFLVPVPDAAPAIDARGLSQAMLWAAGRSRLVAGRVVGMATRGDGALVAGEARCCRCSIAASTRHCCVIWNCASHSGRSRRRRRSIAS